jgi:hypothetical protein
MMTKSTVVPALLLLLAARADATQVVRGPYLQTPTPASIILRWRTDLPTDSRVRYGAAPGSLGQMVDDAIPTTEHVVAVSGFPPTRATTTPPARSAGVRRRRRRSLLRTPPVPGTQRPTRICHRRRRFANADADGGA